MLGYCSAKIGTKFIFVFEMEQLFYRVQVFWDIMIYRWWGGSEHIYEMSVAVPLCDLSDKLLCNLQYRM
jgi:hypothetical protein